MKSTLVFLFAALRLLPLVTASTANSTTAATAVTAVTAVTCYNLDGTEAQNDVPCGSDAVVNCCNSHDICLSNGLCYLQGDRGMVLSRGSCTDRSWGSKCYSPCSDFNRDGGIAIVNVGFDGRQSEYCCGAVIWDDDEVACEYGDGPFRLSSGTAVIGVAGLSSSSSTSSSEEEEEEEDEDDEDDETDEAEAEESEEEEEEEETLTRTTRVSTGLAIALGVGLPLGLLLMGVVLWAVWERRRRDLRVDSGEKGSAATVLAGLHHRYGPISSSSLSSAQRQGLMPTPTLGPGDRESAVGMGGRV